MRRRQDQIIPFEADILAAGLRMRAQGTPDFHGFQLAKGMREGKSARALTSHGSLYKALSRMADSGLLESTWEDPQVAADESRPRRRLYRVTPLGEERLKAFEAPEPGRLQLAADKS